ncbi:MAG: C-type lectin domain-containing protein, partial [Bacteroidota bacterium]
MVLVCLFCIDKLEAQDTFIDQFGTASYSNNDGTQSFSGDWTETNDDNSATGGRIEILGNELEFRNLDNRSIARDLDLSAYSGVTLTLDYDRTNGNESLLVQLFDGTSYNTIATLAGTGSLNYTLASNEISVNSSIQFITGSGNWSGSETIVVDNVTFTEIPDQPPVLTVSGNQVYCPGTSLPIAESVSLTDPDDTTTDAIYIQISSGYVNGEDLLTLTGTHPNITATWDVTEGELTLQGPATFSEFESAIMDVEYSSSAATPSGTRQFSITPGTANYLPSTDHYYEYVADAGISWTDARDAAAASTYFGLQGYLATLVTQEEADFSGSQAQGVGWIGASDATTEGDWQWVTGPEAGTPFWSGGVGGTTTAPFNFAFWNSGEPNNSGNEDYAHITDVSVTSTPGSWNDLPNAGGGGAYAPQGYVVEYGGTTGDPVLSLSGVTTITVDNVAPTASNPSPVTVFCSAEVPSSDINVVIDEADNCTVNPTVTFIGDVSDGGTNPEIITRTYRITDAAGNTTDVTQTITVDPISVDTQPTNQIVSIGNNATFSTSTSNANTLQWQVSTDGGSSFTNISDGAQYTGTTTQSLTVLSVSSTQNGHIFRLLISNSITTCPQVISNEATLIVSIDDDNDGIDNATDLDDDNDGILDSQESPMTVLWVAELDDITTEEQNTIDKLTALGYSVTLADDDTNVGIDANNFAVTFVYEDVFSSNAFTNIANLATTTNGVIISEVALHDEIFG